MTTRMTRKQLAEFHPFNEAIDIQIQEHCQHDIEDTINVLYGMIRTSEMPTGTRELLLNGLAHISCHIKQELKELTTEVESRVN